MLCTTSIYLYSLLPAQSDMVPKATSFHAQAWTYSTVVFLLVAQMFGIPYQRLLNPLVLSLHSKQQCINIFLSFNVIYAIVCVDCTTIALFELTSAGSFNYTTLYPNCKIRNLYSSLNNFHTVSTYFGMIDCRMHLSYYFIITCLLKYYYSLAIMPTRKQSN